MPTVEDLKNTIIISRRYALRVERLEEVQQAARIYLASIMDGWAMPRIVGAQTKLEKAINRLDELDES